MRASVLITTALTAAVHALPTKEDGSNSLVKLEEPSSTHTTTSNEPQQTPDGNSPVIKTCDNGARTKESWKEYRIGEFFLNKTKEQDKFDKNMQEFVQNWGYTENLPDFFCVPMGQCKGSLPTAVCRESANSAKTMFILDSIFNFNMWLQSLREAVQSTSTIADSKAGAMTKEFTTTAEDMDLELWPAIIAGGVLGIIGALFTGPMATALALGGGIASLATGVMSLMNEDGDIELEPSFNNYAEVTEKIGNITEKVTRGLDKFAQHALTDVPNDDKVKAFDDPTSLPRILEKGGFAEEVFIDAVPDTLYTSLFSGAISQLWRHEHAVVVRVPEEEPSLKGMKAPCDDDELFKDNRWCDGGTMYILLHWPDMGSWLDDPWESDVQDKFKLKGVDTLGKYNLDVEQVVKSTKRSYKENDEKPGKKWDAKATIKYLKDNPDDIDNFLSFNLPYCDLDSWTGWKWGDPQAVKDSIRQIGNDECDAHCQLIYRAANSCYPPWRNGGKNIFWKNECSWDGDFCETPCMGGMIGC